MNKIIVPIAKPRNRLVVAAKFKRAGRHHGPNQRQVAKRELQRSLMD